MKIIQTYISTKYGGDIAPDVAYCMALSALLCKKYYGNVKLYTNKKTADIVRRIGIPYSEIDDTTLDGFQYTTFSLPKLKVYSVQTEPYIHIDLDTFLFKDFKLDEIPDVIHSTYPENPSDSISFEDNGLSFYKTYIKGAFDLQKEIDTSIKKHVKFNYIPNMSLFGGNMYDLIKEGTDFCIDLYERKKQFFDANYYNACIIEQLLIPSAIRMILGDDNANKLKFNFLFKSNPTIIDFKNDIWDYPFIFKNINNESLIENDNDLFNIIMHKHDGFLHLNGYKKFDKIVFLIKERILQEFEGFEIIKNINKFYGNIDPTKDLSTKYYKMSEYKLSRFKSTYTLNQLI